MARTSYYDGPVCFQDGWHYTVVKDADGHDVPGERLHLEDNEDGSVSRYRLAMDTDERSWHDRKHRAFATVQMEDGGPGVRVTEDELAAVQEVLRRMREGGEA